MKILGCHEIKGMTVLFLDGKLPMTGWRSLRIDGELYKPYLAMETGNNVISIKGVRDFTSNLRR